MSGTLILFSSEIERSALFPEGAPAGLTAEICGVGPIDAALGAQRLIARHLPAAVLFVGTCGAHAGSGLAVGDVIAARSTVLSSGDVARGLMRLPSLLPERIACDADLLATLLASGDVTEADVSCTLGITESAELADLFWEHDRAHAENMEAFGVARAAGPVPCAVVLGVTNLVGPGGGRGWRENYVGMMRRAWDVALAALAPEERELAGAVAGTGIR